MSKITEQIAIAVGVQAGEGLANINAIVRDATSIGPAEADPVAIGVFIDEETFSLDFDRVEEAVSDFVGTFSKSAGTFQRVDVPFSFGTHIQGGGDPTPTVSGEWNLHVAIETLLRGLGNYNRTEGGSSTLYEPSSIEWLTIKVWRGSVAWVFYDCKVESLSIPLTPGAKSVGTWTIAVGGVQGKTTAGFADITAGYGTQSSQAPPILRGAGCTIGAVDRGFIDGTLTIANEFAEYGDCNAATGIVNETDGREISFTGSVYVDTADPDQDYDALIEETTPTGDMVFQLGDTLGDASNPAQALSFGLRNVRWTQNSYTREAGRIVWGLTGYATHFGSGDDEFVMSGV